jgi:hypothetical protein
MLETSPMVVPPDLRDRLDELHGIFGRDQEMPDILRGLTTRLTRARQLYGPNRSLPAVVSGLYDKLDELRRLYGSESIEPVLDEVIAWRKRFNRLIELQNQIVLNTLDYEEMRAIQREFRCDFAKQKALRRLGL